MVPGTTIMNNWACFTRKRSYHILISTSELTKKCLLNTLRPGDTYICQVPSHYLNQHWLIVNGTLGNKEQWNSNQNTQLSIDENAFPNVVCKMAAILFKGSWVNWTEEVQWGRQNEHHFAYIFKLIFYENYCILIQTSLKFVSNGPISIDSDNGLVPNMPQTSIWTNDGLVYWHVTSPQQSHTDFIKKSLQSKSPFSTISWQWEGTGSWNPSSLKNQCLSIEHVQYHGCWWPSKARSQGINSQVIDWSPYWILQSHYQGAVSIWRCCKGIPI